MLAIAVRRNGTAEDNFPVPPHMHSNPDTGFPDPKQQSHTFSASISRSRLRAAATHDGSRQPSWQLCTSLFG
jgi:hypothetical protein